MSTINSQIKLRGDTLENWNNSELIPLENELCIVYTDGENVRFKVGNGKDKFANLKFVNEMFIITNLLKSCNLNQGSILNNTVDNNSAVFGVFNDAIGNYSEAHGIQAKSSHNYSFVFNGTSSTTLINRYESKGEGTFCINPKGGIEGFYIGEKTLQEYLNELEVIPSYIANESTKIDSDRNFYTKEQYTLDVEGTTYTFIETSTEYVEQTARGIESAQESYTKYECIEDANKIFGIEDDVRVTDENFGNFELSNGDLIFNVRSSGEINVNGTIDLIHDHWHNDTGETEYGVSGLILELKTTSKSESTTEEWLNSDKIALEFNTIKTKEFTEVKDRLVELQVKGKKINNAITTVYKNIVNLFSRCLYIKDATALDRYSQYDLTIESQIIDAFSNLSHDFNLMINVTTMDDVNTVMNTLCEQYDVSIENLQISGYNNTIINVADPVNDTDVATKKYVDEQIEIVKQLINS